MVDFTDGTWRSLIDGEEVSAIPDSEADQKLLHRWVLDDVNGTVEDSAGNADGTNNGVSSIDGDWAGGAAGDGDGAGDFINVGTLGSFGSALGNDFAVAFSLQVIEANLGSVDRVLGVDHGGGADTDRFEPSVQSDRSISFLIADNNGNRQILETGGTVPDMSPARIVINKTQNTAPCADIYINKTAQSITENDSGTLDTFVDFDNFLALFARNNQGTVDLSIDAIVDDICLFNDSLTTAEIDSYNEPWT